MWLGATDEYSEGQWKWITGEPINYKNWADGEPNDTDDEDFMMIYKSSGKWNDVYDSTRSALYSYSFICEYDNQVNTSNFTIAKTFEYDRKKYEVYSNIVDWQTAKNLCAQKGGHLVTIESADENNAIFENIKDLTNNRYWIGITDVNSEGTWSWVNGETSTYSNWNTGEPNNDGGLEDYGEILADSGKWNDMAGYYCIHRNIGFICEYEPKKAFLGDVDGDGNASVIDATFIQRYNVNMQIPITEEVMLLCGDVDGDGEVTVIDATFILRYEVMMNTSYPIGEPIFKTQ